MKKILRKLTGWLIKKTDYTPELPLPIQPVIIKPKDLKRFRLQNLISWFELEQRAYTEDDYEKTFIHFVMNELIKQIEVKREKTPDGIAMSVDLLYKNI